MISAASNRLAWTIAFFILAALPTLGAPDNSVSSNALAEISAVLQEKASRTPVQRKMESQLVYALKKRLGQALAPGAPNHRLDVRFEPDGRVLVDITGQVTPQLLALVERGGGHVISSFPQFRAVRALLNVEQLETVAGSEDVSFVRRAGIAHTFTGSVDSQGDATHLAAAARAAFGATGSGVNVGVISDSVDYLSNSQASGDLTNVTVLSGQSGVPGTGEGTAMLEIIHDLAPNAQLYFATGFGSEASFAQNILNLRSAGCDIIVDDVHYGDESPFQDSVVAQAVNTVTAGGALYFSAAGNYGNVDSGAAAAWEGDYNDAGSAGPPLQGTGHLHSFGPATYNTVVLGGANAYAVLFWSDPLGGSANDYDLFLLDSTGSTIVDSSTSSQTGSQDPLEAIMTVNPGERIVIIKKSSAAPRFIHLDAGEGQLSIVTPGATSGHSAATNSFSVAAVDAALAFPGAFTGGPANPVEAFSSDGPRHVFFHASGSAITPGNFSSTGGAIRQKPDLAAADDVSTSVPGFSSFSGTSAAAPHAAAIAALLKSYNSALTPAQIRAVLTGSALDNMSPGVDRDSGAGIVMAMAALTAAPPDALLITPGAGFSASGLSGGPFTASSRTFSLTNNGSASFSWSLANTSLWLTVSPASGTLTPGGAAATVTASLNNFASNLAAGPYSASIWFTNLSSQLGQSRQFNLAVTAPPASSAFAAALLALNPIAYWRLNETNAPPPADVVTNVGSSGTNGNGLGFSGVIQGQPGIVGSSFRFSNPTLSIAVFGSHVDVPYQPAFNPNGPFTVEFWVKPAQYTPDLFSPLAAVDLSQNGGTSRAGWLFYQTNNAWQFRLGGTSGYVAVLTGGTAQTNAWQHVAGVYDGANARLYVNGALAAGPTTASGFSHNISVPLRLGATTIPNRGFDGWLDEVAFYTNALSASVIAAHYSAASTNNAGYGAQILTANPLGYWHLDGPAYTAPSQNGLPVAANSGSLAPGGNGLFQPGSLPGVAGVTNAGFGIPNFGCRFAGNSSISVPGTFLNFTGPMTLLAWARPDPANGNLQSILSKGSAAYRLVMDGGGLPHFAVGAQSAGDVVGPSRIDDGNWHQLTCVYNGTNSEMLYVDTRLVASNSSATAVVVGNTGNFWIGGNPDSGGSQPYRGSVDEAALFTNALTAAQIQQLYFSATNVPPVPFPITGLGLNPGRTAFSFSWASLSGRTYQVQFKSNLLQANWSILTNLLATNITASASDSAVSAAQRFYRVALLP